MMSLSLLASRTVVLSCEYSKELRQCDFYVQLFMLQPIDFGEIYKKNITLDFLALVLSVAFLSG